MEKIRKRTFFLQRLFSRNDRVIYGSKVLRSLAGGTLEERGGVRDVRGVQHGVAAEHAVDGPLLRSTGEETGSGSRGPVG